MLPKTSRVGSARLREVLATGQAARTRLFSAKALPSPMFGISIVAPKRATALATDRNRIKRRCREAFRAARANPESGLGLAARPSPDSGGVMVTPTISLVVTARPEAQTAPYAALVEEAAEILRCYRRCYSKPL